MIRFEWICSHYSLCYFKNSKQPERPETREPKWPSPRHEVDPEDFEDGSSDDDAVESVEGGGEVGGKAQGVKADQHLEHERAQEDEFGVDWK